EEGLAVAAEGALVAFAALAGEGLAGVGIDADRFAEGAERVLRVAHLEEREAAEGGDLLIARCALARFVEPAKGGAGPAKVDVRQREFARRGAVRRVEARLALERADAREVPQNDDRIRQPRAHREEADRDEREERVPLEVSERERKEVVQPVVAHAPRPPP